MTEHAERGDEREPSAPIQVAEQYELLHIVQQRPEASVRRARRLRDGKIVLLEIPKRSSARDIDRMRRELEVERSLDPAVTLGAMEMSELAGRSVLVFEDFSGTPLADLIAPPVAIGSALEIACALATSLEGVHRAGVVHRDIKPHNVWFDAGAAIAKLTGFAIASAVAGEHWAVAGQVEGTLPYMSPEQTGLLNRPIDTRSDLYSLGVTLYELFTGARPFDANDLLGWVHCHIARIPVPPNEVAPQVPRPVSDLVMRLLTKLPEDRYQTATGLLADLRRCQREWSATQTVAPFALRTSDVSDRLLIPKKLYGREAQEDVLSRTLERIAARGVPGVVLVAGSAGVGKSVLARSVEEPVARMRGWFVTGKFEEHGQPSPYSAISRALDGVVPFILAEGGDGLQAWRARLEEALGPLGQLVVDLVPSLELVIGKQPQVPEIPLAGAQARFFLVVRRLVSALASQGQVVVLFLDDLQWADGASLALLADLMTHADLGRVMVIGAYRDNVAPGHPVRTLAPALRDRNAFVEEVALAPLTIENVTELCAVALSTDMKTTAALARVIWDRTGGNALSVTQLVTELYRDGLVVFDSDAGGWRWDLARVSDVSMRDDVVDSTLARLNGLASTARETLEIGACIGTRFDARTLELVTGAPVPETRANLEDAVRGGFLSVVGDAYHFLHDRIHATIYSGISEPRRVALHAWIGRVLLARLERPELARRVFEVTGHLSRGAALLEGQRERDRVAELELQAGRAAAASNAYAVAAIELTRGIGLLGSEAWRRRYDLAFTFHLELAWCELAQGHLDEAQRHVVLLRQRANEARVRDVDRLQVEILLFRTEVSEAVRVAMESLETLGVHLVLHPTDEDLAAAEGAVWDAMAGRSIESLFDLPALTERDVEVALEMLAALGTPAFLMDQNLLSLLSYRMVELTVRHGVAGASVMGFSLLSRVLVMAGRPEEARRFAELAMRFIETHRFSAYAAKTLMPIGSYVTLRTGPLRRALEVIRAAHRAALVVGDVSFGVYCVIQLVAMRLLQGDPLEDVVGEARVLRELPEQAGFGLVAAVLRIQTALVENLQGRTASVSTFSGPSFDEDAFLRSSDIQLPWTACWFHIYKLHALSLHLDYAGALAEAECVRPLLWAVGGMICVVDYHLFAAVAHAEAARQGQGERTAHLRELVDHEAALGQWARTAPQTFHYMRAIVSAERARLEDRVRDAMGLYEQAIHSAHDNGITQGEALAYERAASFYAELGLEAFAELYLREARDRYREWGAHAKVRALDAQRPYLVRSGSPLPATATLSAPSEEPERLALAKVAQLISSEIVHAKLVAALTQTLLEQTGARRTVFLSVDGDRWRVESTAGPEGGVPASIINHVLRSRERILLHDATLPGPYAADPYLAARRPRSIVCLPIVRHATLMGIAYLENDLVPGVFTQDTLAVLELLVEQAGISLENARLFADRGREIAERQQVETTLRSVLDNMVDSVFVCDREARITFTNPAGARAIGLQPGERLLAAELVPRLHLEHPDGTPFAAQELPAYRALAGEIVSSVDMTARDPHTQRAMHYRLNGAPLRDETGAIAGAVVVAVNVTEATELDRLKEQFLRVVAHELKTPVTIVKGYTDVLRRMDAAPALQRRLLGALSRGADRIDRLIADLMLVWQLQTGRLALAVEDRVDLVDLVEAVMGRLDPEDAARVSVAGIRPQTVAGDRELLGRVMSDLVDNALRYSPGGGTVEIDVGGRGDQAVVGVTDHGVGIPEDKQARLFEPFFRAHTQTPYDTGGLGLGLYVSKAIVVLHGGSIHVQTQEGRGSTFRFTLPRSPRPAREATNELRRAEPE